jgi:hypothetical protein
MPAANPGQPRGSDPPRRRDGRNHRRPRQGATSQRPCSGAVRDSRGRIVTVPLPSAVGQRSMEHHLRDRRLAKRCVTFQTSTKEEVTNDTSWLWRIPCSGMDMMSGRDLGWPRQTLAQESGPVPQFSVGMSMSATDVGTQADSPPEFCPRCHAETHPRAPRPARHSDQPHNRNDPARRGIECRSVSPWRCRRTQSYLVLPVARMLVT